MKKRIHNCKDFFCDIRLEGKNYLKKIEKNGGLNFHLRAFVAQILWLTLIYNIGILLIPAKDYLITNAIFIFIVVNGILIRTEIGNKISDLASSYASGSFFYRFDINFLNKSIVFLLLFLSSFVFLNNINFSNFKSYARRK